ncbi:hypothetical protein B0T36_12075 [Nocardia donostiensis]|uniref:hypothetical protein n=1 Tax=Nocardia donostiensis TaxID=1538463 RepID=UPI0009D9CADE|nr:hypothetical protein [Nocardia donostiensis]OQS14803.1 hypothetical protein B0T36_12075 [Nocardia donostiensis]
MTSIQLSDLPAATVEVLARRARLPLPAYVRHELVALGRKRRAVDPVVEFLESQGRDLTAGAAWTSVELGELPSDVRNVLVRRARALGVDVAQYVRDELIASARRTTTQDSLDEIAEAMRRDPGLRVDMDAVAASINYARAE